VLREAKYYWRMVAGAYRFLRAPSHGEAGEVIRAQLARREEQFLDTVQRVIFANPTNPYYRMFELAGCGFADLSECVRRDGLETTLAALERQGVHLTHEEFKGRQAIVRAGQTILASPNSFLNPLVSGLMMSSSSGSSGPKVRTRYSTQDRLYRQLYVDLIDQELALEGRARIEIKSILPNGSGFFSCLGRARQGGAVDRWFTVGGRLRDAGHYRAGTNLLVFLGRRLGARIPYPTCLPPNDFSPVARRIAQHRAQGTACVVSSPVSPAVRVAAAAAEQGLDIRGTIFITGGEALTRGRRRVVEATGAEIYPGYWIHEIGPIGFSCRRMDCVNGVHQYSDAVAVVSRRRRAPLADVEVDALLFTTLLPWAPRVLINADMGDTGVIEPARCRCTFTEVGFATQIRDIASFAKLTGLGVTLVGTDVLPALEVTLPARFGGVAGDYQLVEWEGPNQTQLLLRVNPRLGRPPAESVRACFLEAIRPCQGGVGAVRLFRHAEAIQVVYEEPVATSTGKVHPLHLLSTRQNRHAA
jgi:hypothetical protein